MHLEGCSCVRYGSNFIIFGGKDHVSGLMTNDVFRIDADDAIRQDHVTAERVPCSGQAPSPRCYHGAALRGQFLVVVGGVTASGDSDDEVNQGNSLVLFSLNLDTFMWNRYYVPGNMENPAPRARCHCSLISAPESLLLYGGFPMGDAQDDSLPQGHWSIYSINGHAEVRPLDTKGNSPLLWGHTMVYCHNSLILFGGVDYPSSSEVASVCVYGMDESRWRWAEFPLAPEPRALHTSVVDGSKMWVFGGFTGQAHRHDTPQFNDTWVFSLNTGLWEQMPCTGETPLPRSGHASVAYDHRLFIMGGLEGNDLALKEHATMGILDTRTLMWHTKPIIFPGATNNMEEYAAMDQVGSVPREVRFNREVREASVSPGQRRVGSQSPPQQMQPQFSRPDVGPATMANDYRKGAGSIPYDPTMDVAMDAAAAVSAEYRSRSPSHFVRQPIPAATGAFSPSMGIDPNGSAFGAAIESAGQSFEVPPVPVANVPSFLQADPTQRVYQEMAASERSGFVSALQEQQRKRDALMAKYPQAQAPDAMASAAANPYSVLPEDYGSAIHDDEALTAEWWNQPRPPSHPQPQAPAPYGVTTIEDPPYAPVEEQPHSPPRPTSVRFRPAGYGGEMDDFGEGSPASGELSFPLSDIKMVQKRGSPSGVRASQPLSPFGFAGDASAMSPPAATSMNQTTGSAYSEGAETPARFMERQRRMDPNNNSPGGAGGTLDVTPVELDRSMADAHRKSQEAYRRRMGLNPEDGL